MIVAIRRVLSLVLLWVVWHHAHWSVALSITLINVSNELLAFLLTYKSVI